MAQYEYKELPFSLSDIEAAVQKHPTPFHLYNEQRIRENAATFTTEFRKYFPDFRNFFAVKATPNPHILKIVKQEGMGVDCSSLAELILAEKVGFKGEEIMFTSNCTPVSEYKKALELGSIINLDDITHINYLLENFNKLPDLMCVRYNPGPLKKGNEIIGEPQQAKFGLTRDQVKQAYALMKANNVSHFGLHCMVASNELKVEYFHETAKLIFELVVELSEELNIDFEFVNLGGGIGIPYRPHQQPVNFSELAAQIYAEYQKTVIAAGLKPLRVVMECGRVVTGPYGCLVSKAIHKKDTYKKYIGLDACMSNLMRPGMYGAYHHISVIKDGKLKVGESTKAGQLPTVVTTIGTYDVVGSLCENNDKFAVDRALPEINDGDIVVIHDAGAHGHSMGFNYNGKLRSAEYLLTANKDIVQIRRAETYDDLFATLNFDTSA